MNANILSVNRMRFGTDGEGVRTLVGFCGCPLRCKYCFNKTSWNGTAKGRICSPEMLLEKVRVDNLYFLSSGGGITFGGGEPLLHSDFICEFIKLSPQGWTFNVETSLHVDFENIEKIALYIDLFIVDIKSMDSDIYFQYTGGNSELVKNNLE
ncbi:MAG: radical SAM protein, partial [Clostridia bacterium]|nr:radical SAM protein [Clostridia bacterium]